MGVLLTYRHRRSVRPHSPGSRIRCAGPALDNTQLASVNAQIASPTACCALGEYFVIRPDERQMRTDILLRVASSCFLTPAVDSPGVAVRQWIELQAEILIGAIAPRSASRYTGEDDIAALLEPLTPRSVR
jgi:hypothetical protein